MNTTIQILIMSFLITSITLKSSAQEVSKKEKVQIEIEEIIQDIDGSIDSIFSMDKIDRVYAAGDYAKLNNLIAYYDDLGGAKEQVTAFRTQSEELGMRLIERREAIDIGNIIDLKYKVEVESDLKEIADLLGNADSNNIYDVKRLSERQRKMFDIVMRNNTVMADWKNATIVRMDQLKKEIEAKEASFKNDK